MYYNGSNIFLFVNAKKIYQFKAKDSEIKKFPLCLGNISGDFSANNMRKTGLSGCVYGFPIDYRTFDTINTINIHKYLMKKRYKIMFGLIKKKFIGLLSSLVVNASSHTKCVSLSNQKCNIESAFINLHPNEYRQELHYPPFTVKLDKYVGSCNTLNDVSNSTALRYGFFLEKTLKKSTCDIMIRIIIIFSNQIFLQLI